MTDERIARLRELDSKRTPGGWSSDYRHIRTIHPKTGHVVKIAETPHVPELSVLNADSRFIAAAPEMMQIINELQAKLKTAEGALESIKEYAVLGGGTSIHIDAIEKSTIQALAEIRK